MSGFKKGDRVYRTSSVKWAAQGAQGTVLAVNPSGSLKVEMDNGHITPNGSSRKFALVNATPTEGGSNMSGLKINIVEQVLVNGRVVDDNYSDDMIFADIASGEKEIKRLEAIETKPAALEARIEELKTALGRLKDICDGRSSS